MNDTTNIIIDLDPTEVPILYTDNINIVVNDDGVILNVCQKVGPRKYHVITRIGMSTNHAQKVASKLAQVLLLRFQGQDDGSSPRN